MHDSYELVTLYGAVDYVVQRLNHHIPKGRCIRGVLKIYDMGMPEFWPVLNTYIGDFVPDDANTYNVRLKAQSDRAHALFEQYKDQQQFPPQTGFVSSDLSAGYGGAVILGNLIMSFTDLHSNEEGLRDEAIVLMATLRAGYLSKRSLRTVRGTSGKPKFNPHLRRYLDTITWTK